MVRTAQACAGTWMVPANTQQLACMEEGLPAAAEAGGTLIEICTTPPHPPPMHTKLRSDEDNNLNLCWAVKGCIDLMFLCALLRRGWWFGPLPADRGVHQCIPDRHSRTCQGVHICNALLHRCNVLHICL